MTWDGLHVAEQHLAEAQRGARTRLRNLPEIESLMRIHVLLGPRFEEST